MTNAAVKFDEMMANSIMKTIVETATLTDIVPSLGCVSFGKEHSKEICKIVDKLNEAKSKEDLEAAYTEYLVLGVNAGASMFEILTAINSCINSVDIKLGFNIKTWIEKLIKDSMAEAFEDNSEKAHRQESAKKPKEEKPEEPVKEAPKSEGFQKAKDRINELDGNSKKPETSKSPTFQEAPAAHKQFGFDVSKFVTDEAKQTAEKVTQILKEAEQQKAEKPQEEKHEEVTTLEKKVKQMQKNFHLIAGTHPGFTESQVDSLLMLAKNGYVKKKMKEYGAVDRYNNPQFYEVPLNQYLIEGYDDMDKFDIAFRLNTKDKKRPIIVLYSTKATWVEDIKANVNNMEIFKGTPEDK